ncbi:hypothetical protein CSUI_005875 [Cystoisospora suis]|uniref:Uncharacterized protein n=1 Tax=Cystoisospora suis TaxID=483139 RepID=A0A2C6KIG4_9APIC|nr:hypothetical protein CSUI_005875 [Cystoisospora suis]
MWTIQTHRWETGWDEDSRRGIISKLHLACEHNFELSSASLQKSDRMKPPSLHCACRGRFGSTPRENPPEKNSWTHHTILQQPSTSLQNDHYRGARWLRI